MLKLEMKCTSDQYSMDDFGERRHSKLKTEQQILPLKIEEIVNAGSKFPHIKLSCYGSLIYLDRLHLAAPSRRSRSRIDWNHGRTLQDFPLQNKTNFPCSSCRSVTIFEVSRVKINLIFEPDITLATFIYLSSRQSATFDAVIEHKI